MKTTRLAVVMFTEIADFAQMTSENEAGAIGLLREHQSIVLPIIAEHDGKVIDQDSGGLLVLFESALAAAQCALLMQFSLRSRNAHCDEHSRILPRIGLHLGDIWMEGERVYGNGVNIASRVMHKARPGGICVSDDVYRQLVNKMEAAFKEVYDAELKNISRTLALYELPTGCESTGLEESPEHEESEDELARSEAELLASLPPEPAAPESPPSRELPPAPLDMPAAIGALEMELDSLVNRQVKDSLAKAVMDISKAADQEKAERLRSAVRVKKTATSRKDRNHPTRRREALRAKLKSGLKGMITGLVLGGGTWAAMVYRPSGWWWPVMILAGFLPMIAGFLQLIGASGELRRIKNQMPDFIQDALLGYAKKSDGLMSVAEAAAATRFPLDEVRRQLETMAKKGYVGRETDANGLISYRFSGKKKAGQ